MELCEQAVLEDGLHRYEGCKLNYIGQTKKNTNLQQVPGCEKSSENDIASGYHLMTEVVNKVVASLCS